MSQYTIKLEQLISSAELGDFLITVQYDAVGPKIVSLEGEELTSDLQAQIAPILHMVNLCLTKGISITEIADLIPVFGDSVVATIFGLLIDSLKSIPVRIQEIHPENVLEINPEMLKVLS